MGLTRGRRHDRRRGRRVAVGYAAAAALAAVAATPAVPAGLLPADRILEASRAPGQVGPFLLAVPTAAPAPPAAAAPGEQPLAGEQALVGARPPQGPPDTATVRALGLSFSQARALGAHPLIFTAYRQAARTARRVDPGCGITWPLLAAIGHVESHHARSSVVLGNGDTRPHILGPQLDGSSDFAAIADTDGGSLDGDSTWDRAVGPMQFIPSTWETSGRDGNRDGVRDPNNIFDATLAAAGYLCAGDRDLSLMSDRAEAVFSYNHSWDYVTSVLSLADAYASGRTVLVPSAEVRVPPAGEPAAGSAGTGRSSNGGSDRSGDNSGDRPRPRDPAPTPTRSSARPARTPTEEPTRSTSATPTRTARPTRTSTASPTGSPSATPTESPTGSPSASPTRTHTPTKSPTGSPTPSVSPTDHPCDTPTPTPTDSVSPTPTKSSRATPSASPCVAPTNPPSASASPTEDPDPADVCVPAPPSKPERNGAQRVRAKGSTAAGADRAAQRDAAEKRGAAEKKKKERRVDARPDRDGDEAEPCTRRDGSRDGADGPTAPGAQRPAGQAADRSKTVTVKDTKGRRRRTG